MIRCSIDLPDGFIDGLAWLTVGVESAGVGLLLRWYEEKTVDGHSSELDSGWAWRYLPLVFGGVFPPEELKVILFLIAHLWDSSLPSSFLLFPPCGCRVVTPEGIVCQHTIKARPVTKGCICLWANCERQCSQLKTQSEKDKPGGCLDFLITLTYHRAKSACGGRDAYELREGNAVIKRSFVNIWEDFNVASTKILNKQGPVFKQGCEPDQTGSPWKMYEVFNQSKMAYSSWVDCKGTLLVCMFFLCMITGCSILNEELQ